MWSQPFPTVVPSFPCPSTTYAMKQRDDSRSDGLPSYISPYPPSHTYMKAETSKKRSISSIQSNPARRIKRIENLKNFQKSLSELERVGKGTDTSTGHQSSSTSAGTTGALQSRSNTIAYSGPPLLEADGSGRVAPQHVSVGAKSQFAKSLSSKERVLLGLVEDDEQAE